MYFALSAIIAAGLLGLSSATQNQADFPQRDVPVNPSTLDEAGRAHYGITQKMPATIDEALAALANDGVLNEALAPGLVQDYLAMKDSEQKMLEGMDERERRVFLIERY